MRKRAVLDCNSVRFAALLEEGAQCTHERADHQVIEGATLVNGHWVNRSLIAGMWTKELCHSHHERCRENISIGRATSL